MLLPSSTAYARSDVRVRVTVIGNRPQFVKAAAVSDRLRAARDEVLVHTGQHYDDELSRVFFDELGLPRPEHQLDLGGGTNTRADRAHAGGAGAADRAEPARTSCSSTATRTRRWRARWPARRPACRWRTSRPGCAPTTATMPEELNRVLADHAADLLLCSSERAADEPARRGGRAARSWWSAT